MNGPFKLLPLLLVVSFLSFSVRLTEVVTGVSNLSNTAFAAAEKEETKKKDDKHKDEKKTDKGSDVKVVDGKMSKEPKWRDAGDSDFDVSGVKLELFKDLSKRRDQLEQREKSLGVKEALLKAAEQELDRKYQELSKLRGEIEVLLNQQSEEENARISSLVKIYEGMKPKDAARIFDTLDMDVLLSVVSKMSERKVSPVLAAMNPERVRTVTIMLAEQKTLPAL